MMFTSEFVVANRLGELIYLVLLLFVLKLGEEHRLLIISIFVLVVIIEVASCVQHQNPYFG